MHKKEAFQDLSLVEKMLKLMDTGYTLLARKEGSLSIKLFELDGFFVEVQYNFNTNKIDSVEIVNLDDYCRIPIQYSKGCPNGCEFCDLPTFDGKVYRTKTVEQFLYELEMIYVKGWKGIISIIDDNFTLDRNFLKTDFFPSLIRWNTERKNPFTFE